VPDDRIKPDRRRQSQTERDVTGFAARKDRLRSAVQGVPVLVPDFDDLTGKYEGKDLALARAKRPTEERIGRLEKKQDEDRADLKSLVAVVTNMRVDFAGVRGELKVLPELVELIKNKNASEHELIRNKNASEHETKRHGMTTRSKVIIAIASAVGTGIAALIAAGAGCS
jgi:hypothetical protein